MQNVRSAVLCLALSALAISGGPPAQAAEPREEFSVLSQTEAAENWGSASEGEVPASRVQAHAEPDAYQPLTGKERWILYLREAFWSPGAFFSAAGPAMGTHLKNEPPEWGQGAAGYSRPQPAIRESIRLVRLTGEQ